MSSTVSSSTGVTGEETKLTEGAEHTRHKRRRRGKKRKFHKSDKSLSVSDINENEADNQMPDTAENRAAEKDGNNVNKRRPRGILIRPINVPKAPKNSTQFIIDDHDGSALYFSFETPNPYGKGEDIETETHVELCGTADDDAFQDMDYTYKSLQDWDDSAYYTQDFEAAYKSLRYDELVRLRKEDLLTAVHAMAAQLEQLEEDLVEYDPNPVLERLQHKLLGLQEENAILLEVNSSLKAMLSVESNESASEQSLEEELSGNEEIVCSSEFKEALYEENIESASEPSVDGNLSENERRIGNLELSGGSNVGSLSVETIGGQVPEHIVSQNEKTEYNTL